MNTKQLELYNTNIIAFSKAVQLVSGDVSSILSDNLRLLEVLSRNGLEINFKLYPNMND